MSKVTITAVQANGALITAHRESFGLTPEAVLANWKSKNPTCSRAAIGDKPAAVEQRSNVPAPASTSYGEYELMDIDGSPLKQERCETCGVTTLSNKGTNSNMTVHRVGCKAARVGIDMVTTIGQVTPQ